MELSKYFFVIAALVTVFCIFVKHSEALAIGDSHGYKDELDDFDRKAAIGGNGSIVITLGQDAIDIIRKDAEAFKALGAHAEATDTLADGLIATIKLIAENGDDAFNLIDKYKYKQISDPEEAIDDIDRGIRVVKQSIYHSGVPVLHALGAAAIIAPNVTKNRLKECLDPLQDSGTAIFNSMDAAQVLAVHGIKSSKRSRDLGLTASHSAVVAGCSSLNSSLIKAGKRAFAYLMDVANGKTNDVQDSADVLSARAKAIARDSETVSVIERIDSEIFKALLDGLPKKVLNEIREGVLADIESSAMGLSAAFKAIEEARKLVKDDPEKALDAIADGFEAARKGCIDGSVRGYQGFGGAAHLVGQKKVFSAAIEIIENSRIDATDGIEAGRKLGVMGLISGGDSIEQGLKASREAVEAVEVELYTKITNAQNVALKVLKAVTGLPGLI